MPHQTFSLLPDHLAARFPGTLPEIERVVAAAERASSVQACADALRPVTVSLPSAMRWVRRRLARVHALLPIVVAMVPQHLQGCAPTIQAVHERLVAAPAAGSATPSAPDSALVRLRVLRQYRNEPKDGQTGWLAGLGDRVVGAALGALYARPAIAWTLEDLAREAGTSRSVLAERFLHRVGSSPIANLTQWRMTLAANLLRRRTAPMLRIAEDVGYQTDTAFSRTLRREYGVPPGVWRRRGGGARLTFAVCHRADNWPDNHPMDRIVAIDRHPQL